MKPTWIVCSLAIALSCAAILQGQGAARRAGKARVEPQPVPPLPTPTPGPPNADNELAARLVHYSKKDLVKLNAKLRYTTLIVLPVGERILDFVVGDRDFWVVNGAENMAYIKPAKTGAQTDLNLITANGNIYSFLLTEVSDTQEEPDLKVFVELQDESMISALNLPPRFVSSQDLEDFRQQAEKAREQLKEEKKTEEDHVDREVNQALSNMRFSYRFKARVKPFNVVAMYHDDRFTYIQAKPTELPVIYEIKDGKPNFVNFGFKNGLFTIPQILDEGYLAIGNAKLRFARKD